MALETSSKLTQESSPPGAEETLAQLERILASPPFRTSKRCSDLLRHVVKAACDGRIDFLKERTVGIAVFEREPDYDTNQDPVVRNTAGQVRKRLALYYLEPGRDRELRIELPAGAYLPQFYKPASMVTQPGAPPPRRRWLMATVVLTVAAMVLALMFVKWRAPSNIDVFWTPMLKQPGAVVLCVGQGHTYKLRGDFDRLFEGEAESQEGLDGPTGTIPMTDVVPIWDRSIGIHDAQTLVRLTALFSGFGHAVEFRGGRSTSLNDLRGRSSVLIGAFNNSWTMTLTGELRFYFEEDVGGKTYLVRDRQHPENRDWRVRNDQPESQDYEDYAIVSRVFNRTTEQVVLVAAGIRGGGTAAAGEFLANSRYLGEALQGAPAGWAKKNVQFVLKCRLLHGTAGPPQLIAKNYW